MSLTPPDHIAPLLTKPVAVLGAARSGEATLALLEKLGARATLYDENSPHARRTFPTAAPASASTPERQLPPSIENRKSKIENFPHSLVIFSPGFPPAHPWLAAARDAGCELLGEIDFASLFWRGPVIAITGTNGKTTLTEFLTHALRSIGHDAESTGNIGAPFSALVNRLDGGSPDTTAIVEVSSFQAETLKHFRATSTLWTNFAEDHLERHRDLRAYFAAKWRLLERTIGGLILVGSSVQRHAEHYNLALPPEACVATEAQPADVLLTGTVFEHYPQYENYLLAAAWWRATGLPETALYHAAHTFRLGRHRLQRIATINDIAYWNDSKATNFHAVESALAQFPAPVLLILGGLSKGGDIPAFVRRIATKTKHALLIGATAPALADACSAANIPHTRCPTLADAVARAAALAQKGDAVLLSPAFASFDMFRGYEDRGDQFEKLVQSRGSILLP